MSLRSRRADAPVSSSASTTILPLTMCSPPAKRSIEATSALRQHVFVIWVAASSAFTCPVIAMSGILPRESTTLVHYPHEGTGEQVGVVAWLPADCEVLHDEPRTAVGDDLLEIVELGCHAGAVGEDRVDREVGGMLVEGSQVVLRP